MSGRVSLVGAGPGDPRLLTLRAVALLRQADVVIYDRLAPTEALDFAPETAERIYVGKRPGDATLDQAAINALIVDRALAGNVVVRLKGGDPFIFGRGGEEALACVAAGIPVEVVPGVSSVAAAPAAAGIPLTHRGLSSSVAIVSASHAPGADADLGRVAVAVDTLVILMAAARLEATCQVLIDAGRASAEPAVLIQEATTPGQRILIATLGSLAADAAAAGIATPATLVVGAVASLAEELSDALRQGVNTGAEAPPVSPG